MNRAKIVNQLIHTLVTDAPRQGSVSFDKDLKPYYKSNFGTALGSRVWAWASKEEIREAVSKWSRRECSHCGNSYESLRISPSGMSVGFHAYCTRKCAAASLGEDHWNQRTATTRATLLREHGVINVSQLEEVKRKKEKASMERYGVTNVLFDPSVQRKRKRTLKRNHGVTVATKSKAIVEKMRATCMERYGGPTSFSDQAVKARAEATVAAGMRDPVKWEKRQRKTLATNIRRYGVPNPQQNPEVASRTRSASYFARKEVQHNGKTHIMQGAEPEFVSFLKEKHKVPSRRIQLAGLPTIRHSGHRVHFPDLGVKTAAGLILFDVKSIFTLGVTGEGPPTPKWKSMKAKILGAKEEGYVEHAVFKCGNAWVVVDGQTTWKQVQRFARRDVKHRIRESGVSRLLASGPLP